MIGTIMDITELLAFSAKQGASDLHLSAGLPPMIRVDGLLIEQLLINLFENIARYTPPETQIEIDASLFHKPFEHPNHSIN